MAATARLGDGSNHGGIIITTNTDNLVTNDGLPIAVHGALHSCPITGHGVTSISAITSKTKINDKLVLTTGAIAGCGAIIIGGGTNLDIE